MTSTALLLCGATWANRAEPLKVVRLHPNYLLDEVDNVDEESSRVDIDATVFAQALATHQKISIDLNADLAVDSEETESFFQQAGELTGPESPFEGPTTARFGSNMSVLRSRVSTVHATGRGRSAYGTPGDNGNIELAMDTDGHISGFMDVEGRRYEISYDEETQSHRVKIDKREQACETPDYEPESESHAELLSLPAEVRENPSPRLANANEFRIGIVFDCPGGSYSSKETTAYNSIVVGGSISQSFGTSSLWTGPVYSSYCLNGAWSSSTSSATAVTNVRNYLVGTSGNNWRTNANLDLVIYFTELSGSCGRVYSVPNWFNAGTSGRNTFNASAPGNNRANVAAVVDVDCVNGFTPQHELGHLMGFRHNRYEDTNHYSHVNHGGGIFVTNSDGVSGTCSNTVMSYSSVCTDSRTPGSRTYLGRSFRFSDNVANPYAIPGTMHYDRTAAGNWHAYCDCGRFTARVIDEIAKYA